MNKNKDYIVNQIDLDFLNDRIKERILFINFKGSNENIDSIIEKLEISLIIELSDMIKNSSPYNYLIKNNFYWKAKDKSDLNNLNFIIEKISSCLILLINIYNLKENNKRLDADIINEYIDYLIIDEYMDYLIINSRKKNFGNHSNNDSQNDSYQSFLTMLDKNENINIRIASLIFLSFYIGIDWKSIYRTFNRLLNKINLEINSKEDYNN